MTKKFFYILIAVFLAVQTFSVLHMAEHGYKKHEHHGHLCSVVSFSEQNYSTDLPPAVVVPLPIASAVVFSLFAIFSVSEEDAGDTWPRAPPVFSLS